MILSFQNQFKEDMTGGLALDVLLILTKFTLTIPDQMSLPSVLKGIMMQDIIVYPPLELLRHGGGWGTPETCCSLLSEATEDPHGIQKR